MQRRKPRSCRRSFHIYLTWLCCGEPIIFPTISFCLCYTSALPHKAQTKAEQRRDNVCNPAAHQGDWKNRPIIRMPSKHQAPAGLRSKRLRLTQIRLGQHCRFSHTGTIRKKFELVSIYCAFLIKHSQWSDTFQALKQSCLNGSIFKLMQTWKLRNQLVSNSAHSSSETPMDIWTANHNPHITKFNI